MEVPERPQEIKEMLETLFSHIDTGNLNAARAKIESLRNLIGSDPELTKAEVLIRRKEILGK